MKTRIFNLIYSVAAAIVIFGAWQKIEHFRYADTFLTAGLLTEVVIWMTAWTGCKYRGMGLDPNEELSDYLKKHGIKESSITP